MAGQYLKTGKAVKTGWCKGTTNTRWQKHGGQKNKNALGSCAALSYALHFLPCSLPLRLAFRFRNVDYAQRAAVPGLAAAIGIPRHEQRVALIAQCHAVGSYRRDSVGILVVRLL